MTYCVQYVYNFPQYLLVGHNLNKKYHVAYTFRILQEKGLGWIYQIMITVAISIYISPLESHSKYVHDIGAYVQYEQNYP